jgi:hypothetical protein
MSQVRRSLSSLGLPLVAAWGLAVACYEEPLFPLLGYETDDVACSDDIDNDGDCLVDCEDSDCLELSTLCGEVIPEVSVDDPEDPAVACLEVELADGTTQLDCTGNLQICRDFVDNDIDGQFDCGDRGCQDVLETGCLREVTNELCSDGRDNDQNGFQDCEDFGCLRSPLVDVCGEGELVREDGELVLRGDGTSCADGVDGDRDGKVDCEDDCDVTCIEDNDQAVEILAALGLEDDPELVGEHCCIIRDVVDTGACTFTRMCGLPELGAACGNGDDDDRDGYVDCNDRDCLKYDDPEAMELCDDMEITLAECTNGVDDDRDGDVDCTDRECGQNPEPAIRDHCNGLEASVTQCSDGVDNDANDYIDCEDFGCSMSEDPAARELCMGASGVQLPPSRGGGGVGPGEPGVGPEDTVEECSDGQDSDDDGFTDCNDFSCSMNTDPAILELCASMQEGSLETCSDGEDNDGNGFIDCADFGCSMSEDPAVLALCEEQEESTVAECSDGEDNDMDGFADCADFSCSMSEDPELQALCPSEDTVEACSNGVDDDGNGFTDCQDFGCSQSEDPAVLEVCEDQLENTVEHCLDGEDNDGNGFIDCADFGCSQADDFAVRQVCSESLGMSNAETDQRCSDGLDNDHDGFTDCADFECSHNAEVGVCPTLSYCETGR